MNPDPLETKIHEALRSLPPRRAPLSLEARVQAEIARRAALPWWKKSWSYWPGLVRGMFLVLSAAICAGTIAGVMEFLHGGYRAAFGRVINGPWQTISAMGGSLHTVLENLHRWIGLIPSPWLYGVVGGITFLYLVCFAVGAGVYRFVLSTES